jgi:hypothetical protein
MVCSISVRRKFLREGPRLLFNGTQGPGAPVEDGTGHLPDIRSVRSHPVEDGNGDDVLFSERRFMPAL